MRITQLVVIVHTGSWSFARCPAPVSIFQPPCLWLDSAKAAEYQRFLALDRERIEATDLLDSLADRDARA
jgi:hypothetical protein